MGKHTHTQSHSFRFAHFICSSGYTNIGKKVETESWPHRYLTSSTFLFCFLSFFHFRSLNKQRQLVCSPKHLASLAFTTSSSRSDSNWLVILLQTHAHSHTTQMSDRTGEVFFSLNFLALINIMIWLNIYIKFAITVTYIGIWLLFLLF